MLQIHDILDPRIHAPGQMDPDPDPDPDIFVIDPQDGNKKQIKKRFFAYYFLMVYLHHFQW